MKGDLFQPAYVATHERGLLARKVEEAWDLLNPCSLCPRQCAVDRPGGETGFCRASGAPEISSYGAHFGEEQPLVGEGGSGTIFMTHCNLGCIFCQNYPISRLGEGQRISFEHLALILLMLQQEGCHNINFVSPSHFVPHILKSLALAVDMGLRVPLVYNTGGYDSLETLRLLDGVVDIYMPDFKFIREDVARQLAEAADYPEVARAAIREMHRQTGDLVMDDRGIARRGLLVRHLVLPEGLAGTREVMHFLATEVSKNTYVNIMDQYHPCGDRIPADSPLSRRITWKEFDEALGMASAEGLTRIDRLLYR
jgi:putative pyruvate formate lyase activating enzyme